MKNIEYNDESDYTVKIFSFDDYHYSIIENIYLNMSEYHTTPIMTDNMGSKLQFGLFKPRTENEDGEVYRITVEKVS